MVSGGPGKRGKTISTSSPVTQKAEKMMTEKREKRPFEKIAVWDMTAMRQA